MSLFFIIFNIIIFFEFAKYSIGLFEKIFLKINSKFELITFLFIPFFYPKNFKKEKKSFYIAEIFSVLIGLIFGVGFQNILQTTNPELVNTVFLYLYLISILLFFLHISIHDLLYYTIPTDVVKNGLFSLIIINMIGVIIQIFVLVVPFKNLSEVLKIGTIDNILGAVLGFFIVFLIVKLTKNEGMGDGDIDTSLILGLILGLKGVLISYLITFILGGFFSIFYAIYKRKLKDVIVPFVPLQLIGLILTLFLFTFSQNPLILKIFPF